MSHRTKLRSAVAAAACCAALMAGTTLLASPAQAGSRPAAAPAAAVAHRQTRPEAQVTLFFSDYRDAVLQQHSEGKSTVDVRKEYLTPELDDALTEWSATHQKDPVFRSQNVPNGCTWRTADTSPEGHSTVILTQTWDDGTTTDVWYQVRLDGLLIDGLTDPPAPVA
ncbi:hypothetical protein [Kitasatospora sp. MBT63]|uniref:hypothetical protein n=1 Tax=Kitasatospora sp. MBT63 TaxID=1444768 RepID=UPI00053AA939|nr:hypothetical protein [Kitasatospora sp. MBT63]